MCRGIGLHLFFAQVYSRDIVIRYIYGMETYEWSILDKYDGYDLRYLPQVIYMNDSLYGSIEYS